jgi:hypothetical protein
MFKSRTISIPISRPYVEVYEFLADPRNFPSWASNLGADFVHVGGAEWATTTRNGRVILRFASHNEYGVLDHAVYAEGAMPFTTPMRVIRNNDGAEVLFTLMQRPGMTDAEFESEAEWVSSDFEALRSLLESGAPNEVVFHDESERDR